MTDETNKTEAARAADPLIDEERARTNEKLREELLDKLMQLNADRIASMDPHVLQHWLLILDGAVNAEHRVSPDVDEADVDEADDAEDVISPLQSMSDALAELDLNLEQNTVVVAPFMGMPTAQTAAQFVEALLSGDEKAANNTVQRHCDAAFGAALKAVQRSQSSQQPLEPGESPRDRGQRAANTARVSVVHGALFYARFFAATATTLANAELHVADEAAEGNTRAKA